MRNTEKVLPITWDGWDEAGEPGNLQFYNVEFIRDFGPWKSGDKVSCLYLSMQNGILESYSDDGNSIDKTANIEFKVI